MKIKDIPLKTLRKSIPPDYFTTYNGEWFIQGRISLMLRKMNRHDTFKCLGFSGERELGVVFPMFCGRKFILR